MNKLNEVVKELNKLGYEAKVNEVVKNTIKLTSVLIMVNKNLGSNVYVDDLINGDYDVPYMVDEVIKRYNKAVENYDLNIEEFFSRKSILENVYVGVQRSGSEDLVKKEVSDMPGIEKYIYIRSYSNETYYSIKISSRILKMFNITVDKAWELADEHSMREAECISMSEVLHKNEFADFPMCILSNKCRVRGASAVFNKELLENYGNKFNTNKVIAIPSSIHEFIIMPYDDDIDIEMVNIFIKEVNKEVLPEEILGEKAFILNV